MIFFDLILLILLGGFIMFGFWFGFIHTLGSLVGILAGTYLAGHYYAAIADWGQFIWGSGDLGYVISFLVILIIVNRLVGLAFYAFDRMFELISLLPFLNSINRLAGAIMGFFEGAFTIGIFLFFLARYPVSDWLAGQLQASEFAPWFIGMARFLAPLLPELVRQLQGVI